MELGRRSPTLGDELRLARERRGFTLRETAVSGGFSKSSLSKWERSLGHPTYRCLEQLAVVLQVTIVISPLETYIEIH